MIELSSILAFVVGWVVLALVTARVMDNPRGDPVYGLAYRVGRVYAALVHRLRVEGADNLPRGRDVGPLIVVCNHTAGVDPVLVQAVCDFEVRWMMATDMRLPRFEAFWKWAGVIAVNRKGRDLAGAREAIRHLENGGVVGVFPEGRIERPARTILPFHSGVGFLVAKTCAPVLPVVIEGTPDAEAAWGSLWMPSRAVLRVGEVMRFEGQSPAEIAEEIRGWFLRATGWPAE